MQGNQGDQRLVAASGGYPQEWELDVLLRDGTAAHLRPIRADDEAALVAFHTRLSAQTIYRRFFSPRPVLPPRDVHRFTNVDYQDRMALVAEIGGELAGVARYDRAQNSTTEAEVAFVIEDRHQGRGLGSLLLEHLAGAARERGIDFFVAETLAENRAMLGVFRDAGFIADRHFDGGVVHLRFPIAETSKAMDIVDERERRSAVQSMTPLLRPRSIAVIGASRKTGSLGHRVLRNLLDGEFQGPIYPVNREAASIAGVPAHESVASIPGDLDLAIITVPAAEVRAVVDACGLRGVRAVVVMSAGFAETGRPLDADAQDDLVRLARHHGMRLAGPNGMGVITTGADISMNATPSAIAPPPGRVAFLAQSGGLGLAVVQQAAAQGVGLSSFVSVGNRADVSGNDLLQYWEADGETDVILLYLETFGNPRKFARIARRVSASKPIVVVKSGRNRSADAATDALFRQAGVIRVDSLAELFDVSLLLAHQPLPSGPRLAIITNAAGTGALGADVAAGAGVELAALAQGNPLTLGSDATPDDYRRVLREVLDDDAVDAVLVVGSPPIQTPGAVVLAVVEAAAGRPDKPVIASYVGDARGPRVIPGSEHALHPIPLYPFPEQAVRALGRVVAHAQWRSAPDGRLPEPEGMAIAEAAAQVEAVTSADPAGRWLDEQETAAFLGSVGIAVVGNGVRAPASDGAATGLVEAVIGVGLDPSFGPLLSFGLGGGLVSELLDDRAFRIVPLTDVDAHALLRSIRLSPLLFGYDGSPPVDERALVDLLCRVSALADAVPELAELELRPVVASATGVTVQRARVRLVSPPTGPGPLLRRLR